MKLAVIASVVGFAQVASPARADVVFEEYGFGEVRQDAHQLVDASCELDVELHGTVATVELREKITNPGAGPLAARLDFALPRGAVVTGASLRGDVATAVPAGFSTEIVDNYDVLAADPLTLTSLGGDRYRALMQPIGAGHDAQLAVRWSSIAEVRDGALRLAFPRRASSAKLADCKGTIRATPGPGAAIGKIRVNGADTRGSFVLAGSDVTIAVDLVFSRPEPVVWTQSQDLGNGFTATLVTAIAPPIRSTAIPAHRALFVVDGSRSMALVGPHNVARVIHAIGAALPANTQIDAIVYDRKAARVLGDWRPSTADNLAAIETAVKTHVGTNGSDVAAAFALAHTAIADGARGSTMVIAITDGVLGQVGDTALSHALDAKTSTVDVHAIVLDPASTRSPGATALRNPVNLYGGTYVEVPVDELDDALTGVGAWLRPSWLELQIEGTRVAMPSELRTGSGVTVVAIDPGPAHAVVLAGHGETPIRVAARPGPSVPVAALALPLTNDASFAADGEATKNSADARRVAIVKHPGVSAEHALVVLASSGRIAKSRHDMVAGGGRYVRVADITDPAFDDVAATGPAPLPTATAIERSTLERLFRDQLQPRAYACYQRALGRTPKLAGTVYYDFELGRGEVTQVTVTGIGDPTFLACLVDAGYQLSPPLPDFTVNADDQTIARYPLTFNTREDRAVIVLGDADSSSPLDIDAIKAGVPTIKHPHLKVDTSTPLGGLKPHP
jgi:hypothetical protein